MNPLTIVQVKQLLEKLDKTIRNDMKYRSNTYTLTINFVGANPTDIYNVQIDRVVASHDFLVILEHSGSRVDFDTRTISNLTERAHMREAINIMMNKYFALPLENQEFETFLQSRYAKAYN